jgi:hypothetical protein
MQNQWLLENLNSIFDSKGFEPPHFHVCIIMIVSLCKEYVYQFLLKSCQLMITKSTEKAEWNLCSIHDLVTQTMYIDIF